MSLEGASAPALSTQQEESAFEFHKVESATHARHHLGIYDHNKYRDVIADYYSLNDLVTFLQAVNEDSTKKYKNITLQFPDYLLADSAAIVYELQNRLEAEVHSHSDFDDNSCQNDINEKQKIWILADTSYSACCVDEVAAEHVNSDLVIHFGDACLNAVKKTEVVYVLGKPHLNITNVIDQFKQNYSPQDQILLMADAPHTIYLKSLYQHLKPEFPNIAYADLNPPKDTVIIGYEPESGTPIASLRRRIIGGDIDNELANWDVFYLSVPEAPRYLQLSTQFKSITTFDPKESKIVTSSPPNIMRRYKNVHVAKTAGTIGILVNTLSIANTKELINSIGQKIKASGKKHYIFVVGKPNVAKLANFANIDIWCVLGCDQQGIIIDQTNDYFKPIITPYELNLALGEETWTGKWVTSFNEVLKQMRADEQENIQENEQENEQSTNNEGEDAYSDEEPEFDPVTGKYISTSRPLRRLQHLQITADDSTSQSNENSLVKKLSSAVVLKNTVSTSSIYLQSREWTGLGSDFKEGDNEPAILEEGRSGIARANAFDDKEIKHQ